LFAEPPLVERYFGNFQISQLGSNLTGSTTSLELKFSLNGELIPDNYMVITIPEGIYANSAGVLRT
jgi:hypothetical protein